MRRVCVALLVALVACGDGDGATPGPFEGVWTGPYTITEDTTVVQAELQLSQSDDQVLGTLTVEGRSASVNGTVSGDRLEATWVYLDQCSGEGTTTADLVDGGLVGTYEAADCERTTSGEYTLTKQE